MLRSNISDITNCIISYHHLLFIAKKSENYIRVIRDKCINYSPLRFFSAVLQRYRPSSFRLIARESSIVAFCSLLTTTWVFLENENT